MWWAALGAASRVRPEPLNLAFRPITALEMCSGGLSPNPMISFKRRRAGHPKRCVDIPVYVEDLEGIRTFYETHFDAQASDHYHNPRRVGPCSPTTRGCV